MFALDSGGGDEALAGGEEVAGGGGGGEEVVATEGEDDGDLWSVRGRRGRRGRIRTMPSKKNIFRQECIFMLDPPHSGILLSPVARSPPNAPAMEEPEIKKPTRVMSSWRL